MENTIGEGAMPKPIFDVSAPSRYRVQDPWTINPRKKSSSMKCICTMKAPYINCHLPATSAKTGNADHKCSGPSVSNIRRVLGSKDCEDGVK